MSIDAELSWDDQKEKCIEGKCFRKAGIHFFTA
jgi:hypothetical protein